ncbi:MAG: asparaginase, partial [Clostridiaceae bacterium]
NVPPEMVHGIKRALDKNIPVVIVSRCFEGRVFESYGYLGGGKQLREMGTIFGDTMSGQQARIKLMMALSVTDDLNEIRGYFKK